ncbi:MAG: ATP-binding domain-containing protein, partial [Gammaproteobacteria bacterium]|nr:ATP-binding domain-containing protein [Gammaproteobacteria bacterium]
PEDQPAEMPDQLLYKVVDNTIQKSGLLHHYKTDKSDRAQTRVENLEELVSAVRQFERDITIDETPSEQSGMIKPLSAFLSHTALESGEGQVEGDSVHLMTLHAAKGLEFPLVFLCGLEEGLFPHQRSVSGEKLEEERRLCYVGMTRAEQLLYISYAENRRLHGSDYYQRPSRFIAEIPDERMREVRARGTKKTQKRFDVGRFTAPKKTTSSAWGPGTGSAPPQWKPGQSVLHPSFGEGVILQYEGHDAHTRVQVNFPEAGTKWLVLAYARLQAV